MAKLDENACDCFFILLHDLYHEIACQEQITRILYAISAVVLHPLFYRICTICQLGIKHFVFNSVRFVVHEALALFLTRSYEFSLSTMLSFKCTCAIDFSS